MRTWLLDAPLVVRFLIIALGAFLGADSVVLFYGAMGWGWDGSIFAAIPGTAAIGSGWRFALALRTEGRANGTA